MLFSSQPCKTALALHSTAVYCNIYLWLTWTSFWLLPIFHVCYLIAKRTKKPKKNRCFRWQWPCSTLSVFVSWWGACLFIFSYLNMYWEVCSQAELHPSLLLFLDFAHSGSWVFVYGNVIQACQYFPQCLAACSATEMFLFLHFWLYFRGLLADQSWDKLNDHKHPNSEMYERIRLASVLKWVWIILTINSFGNIVLESVFLNCMR